MDSMAKNLAKNDSSLSQGQVTVMVMKDKLAASNQGNQPQGHEVLQTETDNMVISDHTMLAKIKSPDSQNSATTTTNQSS